MKKIELSEKETFSIKKLQKKYLTKLTNDLCELLPEKDMNDIFNIMSSFHMYSFAAHIHTLSTLSGLSLDELIKVHIEGITQVLKDTLAH